METRVKSVVRLLLLLLFVGHVGYSSSFIGRASARLGKNVCSKLWKTAKSHPIKTTGVAAYGIYTFQGSALDWIIKNRVSRILNHTKEILPFVKKADNDHEDMKSSLARMEAKQDKTLKNQEVIKTGQSVLIYGQTLLIAALVKESHKKEEYLSYADRFLNSYKETLFTDSNGLVKTIWQSDQGDLDELRADLFKGHTETGEW